MSCSIDAQIQDTNPSVLFNLGPTDEKKNNINNHPGRLGLHLDFDTQLKSKPSKRPLDRGVYILQSESTRGWRADQFSISFSRLTGIIDGNHFYS